MRKEIALEEEKITLEEKIEYLNREINIFDIRVGNKVNLRNGKSNKIEVKDLMKGKTKKKIIF